ncbi:hypothetical protein [Chitinophaga japonensis]|uniref:Membrane protein DUF2157 n=1 Tax=Chitinophaga japonensis TaxID=104662 RepID=A0A562T0H5_CHIJA|nr:hypothetical protein [Chitinophaga japonensis]TWI86586.1 hypothetical protein LX66_3845 [Chitinophaga japonensis]
MIAYNSIWLDNIALQQEATEAYRRHCITAGERERIVQAYPEGFYTPNSYIRIGLFLLTAIIVLFSLGLLMLILADALEDAWRGMLVFSGLTALGALELFIHDPKHYRSGVDDALLWSGVALVSIPFCVDTSLPAWACCALVGLVALAATLRYADSLLAALAVVSLLGCLFYGYHPLGAFAQSTAPFLLMTGSLAIYILARKWGKALRWRHYAHCCTVMEITALLTLYAAGNYFVVRETGNALLGLHLLPGQDMPAGGFFWASTVLLPLLYIVLGVRGKNTILLRTGLVLLAAAVFTIEHYYDVASLEAEMIVGGLALVAFAWALIRYLEEPRHGFTYREDTSSGHQEAAQAESLVIADTFPPPEPSPDPGFKFGGGSGAGGGADGHW